MSDQKVWEETYNVLAKFLGLRQRGRMLSPLEEKLTGAPRRTDFGMTYGPATGKIEPEQFYIPGTLDSLAEEQGLASDDPYGLAAKLEAWKRNR